LANWILGFPALRDEIVRGDFGVRSNGNGSIPISELEIVSAVTQISWKAQNGAGMGLGIGKSLTSPQGLFRPC
jgi:hypothetical protein